MKRTPSLSALCTLLLACAAVSARGTTIQWGSGFNDALFSSGGQALDASFQFEAGAFVSGFTPTTANLSLWAANWRVFDRASEGDGWSSANDEFFDSSALLAGGFSNSAQATSGYAFTTGQQAYVWAYNSKAIATTSEWALITDLSSGGNFGSPWTVPAAATGNIFQWLLIDADTAVFGGVNDAPGGGTPPTVTPGAYSLQTYAVVAVPESSGAFLIGLCGLLGILRRRRFKR